MERILNELVLSFVNSQNKQRCYKEIDNFGVLFRAYFLNAIS